MSSPGAPRGHFRNCLVSMSNAKAGDFDKYATAAILDTGVMLRAVTPEQMKRLLYGYDLWSNWSAAPPWVPLLAEATARRILSDKCAEAGRDCEDARFHRLALEVLRVQGKAVTRQAVAACTRKLVRLGMFSKYCPPWTTICYHSGRFDAGPTYEALHAAAWLEDTDVFRQLLSRLGPILSWDYPQVVATLNLAAARTPVVLRVLQSENPGMFSSSIPVMALLERACKDGDEDVFHFAMDRVEESSNNQIPHPMPLWRFIKGCPTVSCYRRIAKFLWGTLIPPSWPRAYDRFFTLSWAVTGRIFRCIPAPLLFRDENGAQRICFAARRGNLEMVRYFVGGGALRDNPESHWPRWNRTERERVLSAALLNAVHKSHLGVARFLLDRGAPLVENMLSEAVHTGSTVMVRLLVERGADVNGGTPPPLSLAVFHEDMEIFRYLLEQGATLDGDGYRAGPWAMTFARHFGLDSMREELARRGVPDNARLCWVLTCEEIFLCPIRRRDYDTTYAEIFESRYLFREWFDRTEEWHWARMFEIKDILRYLRPCKRDDTIEPCGGRWDNPPWWWPED